MSELDQDRVRAQNLWTAFARKYPPVEKAAFFDPDPQLEFDAIGGLAEPKDEIATYACAATSPEVYARWGTHPPTGLLLMGPPECGKTLLARALATAADTPFLTVRVPRLILQTLHAGGQVGDLLSEWSKILGDMPRLTLFLREVDFTRVESLISRRPDVPVAPAMDFLLEFIDRAIAAQGGLVIGSTSHPQTLSSFFLEPGRFERVVWVQPVAPDDVIAALEIHTAAAERVAGRPLFDSIDWTDVIKRDETASVGDWVRLVHAVLRRKARCEAGDEEPGGVTTQDLLQETERRERHSRSIPASPGRYL